MKRAIIITSFGSTVEKAREENIFPLVNLVKETHPDYDVYLAFTSRIIIRKLKEQGIYFKNEQEVMEELVSAGYEEIFVQPTHLVGGEEFQKLRRNMSAFIGQKALKDVFFGRALFHFMGQEDEYPDDYQIFIDEFVKPRNLPANEGLLLVGHGGINVGNGSYSVLQLKLICEGLNNVRVMALENFPHYEDVVQEWQRLGGNQPKKIHLHPLLLVAGDHALNDLFGDEDDSVAAQLEGDDFEVIRHVEGLGAYESIQRIYMAHLDDALAGRYQEALKK